MPLHAGSVFGNFGHTARICAADFLPQEIVRVYRLIVNRTACSRLIMLCLIQKIAQSVISHLSFMLLLHVSTCIRSSSGNFIRRHKNTESSVNCVVT